MNEYISIYVYIYLIALMFKCDSRFHAVLLGQSSGRERKIFEKSNNSKNTIKRMFTLRFVCIFFVNVCVYLCVLNLRINVWPYWKLLVGARAR